MLLRRQYALHFPKTVALLLSAATTVVWLGAVCASFAHAAKAPPRHIELASVTVVAKAAAKVAHLTPNPQSTAAVAGAHGKL